MAPPRKKSTGRRAAPVRQQPRRPGRSGNPATRAAGGPGRGGTQRPLPPGETFFTPTTSPLRRRIERTSAPLLVLFHRVPRPVFAILPLLLLILGAFVPNVALALVFLVLALLLLGWLAFLSWPRAQGGQKAMRLLVPLLVVAIGILRVTRG